jgi:cytochrome c-type biogenesis protein CcmE
MKPRQQRMLAVGLVAIGLAIAATFTLRAFKDNMMFFVEISDVMAGNYPKERNFRIGGLVVAGTIEREEGSMDMAFMVTDTRCALPVTYNGVVPDLFREGQGVVAHGRMGGGGTFVADKIMAKHDEEYMAPEVADSIAKHVQDQTVSVQHISTECNPGDS